LCFVYKKAEAKSSAATLLIIKMADPATTITTDFGELSSDEAFKERINSFETSFQAIKNVTDQLVSEPNMYENLSPADKVRLVTCWMILFQSLSG